MGSGWSGCNGGEKVQKMAAIKGGKAGMGMKCTAPRMGIGDGACG